MDATMPRELLEALRECEAARAAYGDVKLAFDRGSERYAAACLAMADPMLGEMPAEQVKARAIETRVAWAEFEATMRPHDAARSAVSRAADHAWDVFRRTYLL